MMAGERHGELLLNRRDGRLVVSHPVPQQSRKASMHRITISGASDDVIDLSGAVEDEFYFYDDDGEQGHLSFSDGTTLTVLPDAAGVWRITEGEAGVGILAVKTAPDASGQARTDVATIDLPTDAGNIAWVRVASDGGRGPRRIEVASGPTAPEDDRR